MQIYLPIAEMSVNIFGILLLGGVAGLLSGMFGIGGGFLMTPMLIFMGVPPPVAVASSATQIIGASFSGFLAHWRKSNVDFGIGTLLLLGGFLGSAFGVWLFKLLKEMGQIDLVISLAYVGFLGTIGAMMALESGRTIWRKYKGGMLLTSAKKEEKGEEGKRWALPFRRHFPHSDIEVSIILPFVIGIVVGILVSLMGIGGGFISIPAMIYILGMPTSVVIGTSLFQIIFVTANVTLLQAINTQTVDIMLAILLLIGAVVGVQYGAKISLKTPAEYLRMMLSLMVLAVVFKLGLDLFLTPEDVYSVIMVEK